MRDKEGAHAEMNSEEIEQWLEEISRQKGLSRQETIEDLVSSYWRLEEIFHLLQDADIDLGRTPGTDTTNESPAEVEIEELRDRVTRLTDRFESETVESAEVEELRRQISELDRQLGAIDGRIETLSDEIEAVRGDELSDQASIEARFEAFEDDLNRTESTIEGLEARLDELARSTVREERFQAYVDEAEDERQSLRGEQQSLRELVRTEFGHIRTILTHLLETSRGRSGRVDKSERGPDGEFRRHLNDESTLASILREASREGAQTASCSHCDRTVDLPLLEDPSCPHCEGAFDGLETEQRYWGLSKRHILSGSEKVED